MNKTVFFHRFRRLFGFVLTISLLGSVWAVSAQNARISIKMEDASIAQVMKEIENQTRYLFINKGVDTRDKVSIDAAQKTVQDVLAQLFADTDISYQIDDSYIILTRKDDRSAPVSVSGKILDAAGSPIVGASILVQGTTVGVSSDIDGTFTLQVPAPAADRSLEISFIGYTPVTVAVANRTYFEIRLEESASQIESVVVTALGIKRSEKAVAYNVQQVKTEDLTTVKDANTVNDYLAYAVGHLGKVQVGSKEYAGFDEDFVTVNPYLGTDGVKPFVDVCKQYNKGIFVLVKTSNPSSGEFQDQLINGRPLYELVAEKVVEWGEACMGDTYSNVGCVVGATYPEMGKILRKLMPKTYILVPGYGAQGGKAEDLVHYFNPDGLGAIVNSSRGIIAAYKQDKYASFGETGYADASRQAVKDMIADINGARANR